MWVWRFFCVSLLVCFFCIVFFLISFCWCLYLALGTSQIYSCDRPYSHERIVVLLSGISILSLKHVCNFVVSLQNILSKLTPFNGCSCFAYCMVHANTNRLIRFVYFIFFFCHSFRLLCLPSFTLIMMNNVYVTLTAFYRILITNAWRFWVFCTHIVFGKNFLCFSQFCLQFFYFSAHSATITQLINFQWSKAKSTVVYWTQFEVQITCFHRYFQSKTEIKLFPLVVSV